MHFLDFTQELLSSRIKSALFEDNGFTFFYHPEQGTFKLILPDSVDPEPELLPPEDFWKKYGMDHCFKSGFKPLCLDRTLDFAKVKILAVEYVGPVIKCFSGQDNLNQESE